LKRLFSEYDAIILSGGVSAGKYDYIPDALGKLGVEKHFHQVAQRPGKPFWFGTKKEEPKTVAFALPGNPVSSFMCTVRYIIPWLEKSIGIAHRRQFALLSEDVAFRAPLTFFLQVRLEHKADGRVNAIPADGHGSGDFANLVDADAFLELPPGGPIHHAGGSYPAWSFR
jgi:molybdopterin molybdotransferase